MSDNTLQSNPSDASADAVWPDWNSKHGTGTAPEGERLSFEEVYQTAKEGNKERLAGKKPSDPGLA